MSAAPIPPTATAHPEPPRAAPTIPAALSRVLGVVRRLIDIGRHLAATAQQRAAAPGFACFAQPFGTADLAAILARITNGLRRAVALEAALKLRAQRGRDVTPSPFRMPAPPKPHGQQAAPPDPQPANPNANPLLARLPTEAEIAAEIRRRPIGAVIVDICHDLGITPGALDRAFWDELRYTIIAYGGNLAGFLGKLGKRMFAFGIAGISEQTAPP